MTSKLTRERLQEITEEGFLKHGESKELARIALAAIDSEPVAYRWNYGGTTIWRLLDTKPGPGSNPRFPRVIEPLYRHAQQPVVPPMQHWEELCREHPDMSIGYAIIRAAWWNHCRAAMLNGGNDE
ncbi:TPA: hypothetical protein ACTY1G_002003 [Klebsiella michiganensis]